MNVAFQGPAGLRARNAVVSCYPAYAVESQTLCSIAQFVDAFYYLCIWTIVSLCTERQDLMSIAGRYRAEYSLSQFLLNENQECASFGAYHSPGRKYGPKVAVR